MASGGESTLGALPKIVCEYCKKTVVNHVKCKKCNDYFHPRCMVQSSQAKSAVCRHDDESEDELQQQEDDHQIENGDAMRYIAENKLLRRLVKELESKCEILNHQNKPKMFSNRGVNAAISKAQSSNKMKEILDLENKEGDDDGWEKVVNRRMPRKSRKFVVGGNEENTGVTTIAKYTSLHVTRLNPSTEPDDLKKILMANFPEVTCEKHQSKHPELYASMKVTIKQEHFAKAWKRYGN
ncbi:unnamed protein product [Phaedon cochleariae]|uniref:Uncharacterized protein n=1 Tax=Phaedon cochleariae TaxID=80249 RepID=A0A9N9SEF2_PHACE|nr:unnamed protein product [Phaedon cochleariae]